MTRPKTDHPYPIHTLVGPYRPPLAIQQAAHAHAQPYPQDYPKPNPPCAIQGNPRPAHARSAPTRNQATYGPSRQTDHTPKNPDPRLVQPCTPIPQPQSKHTKLVQPRATRSALHPGPNQTAPRSPRTHMRLWVHSLDQPITWQNLKHAQTVSCIQESHVFHAYFIKTENNKEI